MRLVLNTIGAIAVVATALSVSPSFAKGGDGGENRAKLKAEIAKSRAKNGDQGGSFFDRLFGGEPTRVERNNNTTQ